MTDIFGEEFINSARRASPDPSVSGIDPAADTRLVPDFEDTEYQDAKDRFAELVKNRRSNALNDLQRDITAADESYQHYVQQTRTQLWTLNDLRSQESMLRNLEDTKVESLEAEFDGLTRHAKVAGVGIRGEEILIKTVPLTITSEAGYSDEIPLGEFEIVIPTTARRSGSIRLLNRTNARENGGVVYHHPHVTDDGGPCFGAVEEQIINALSQGEYGGAFELILQYLQTYNPEDSYGDHIRFWQD